MAQRKSTKKYYFSVEGETERWYLLWLQDKINKTEEARYKVSFDCPVQKNPIKRAKALVVTGKIDIYHLSDYESDERNHVEEFTRTMDNMKKAKRLGKAINYRFGYSNLTFDLWIILHKATCNGHISHRSNYLQPLNRFFAEKFESMDEYKHENNFKRILNKLEISDVIAAINRAKFIMQQHEDNGDVLQEYKGYKYYKENPSLMIWESIENILKDCNLLY